MDKSKINKDNPNWEAINLNFIQWIWKFSKGEMIFLNLFFLLFTLGAAILGGEFNPWTPMITSALWALMWLRWYLLYRKNVHLYHYWEATYADKLKD